MKNKLMLILLLLLFGILLVACDEDSDEATEETTDTTEQDQVTVSDEERVADDTVVGTVNGEEINGATYNMIYSQVKTQLFESGADTEDLELVKEQTLQAIISQEVLMQDAVAKGIEVPDEEVDAYIEESIGQFDSEEQFNEALENLDYTMESYREQARVQLQQEAYIEQEFADVEISDEDIEAYYEEISSQGEDVPELNQVRDQIESQLANSQLQEKLTERITQLKEEAEVEKAI
ncbi:SurA N-terminal domain-containing protein [Paraliobacillus sediminis]|uniref:SurA N-terminal domain-containing protein n=1 Tax=Paraliobacillus sediminis TaxID=1885916 RepID=UPI000E3CBF93|nr:SurA N-terminal domain-containing protein [Paraliobacillus sediminis]